MSEGELIERIREGNGAREAEEALYRLVRGAILLRLEKKIPARLQSRIDAEDILHEAFLRGLKHLDQFAPGKEGSFQAWVYTIAKNLLLDLNKRRSVIALHPQSEGKKSSGSWEERLPPHRKTHTSEVMRADWIDSLLGKLPEKQAEVIRLRILQGKSFEEIAEAWKSTPGAVQRFYSRAWESLRGQADRPAPGP